MSVLPEGTGFESIAPQCARATVESPWPPGVVAVFLIGDHTPLLVDTGPGTPRATDELHRALQAWSGSPRPTGRVLLTHGHLDHIGGLPHLERLGIDEAVAHRKAVTWMAAEDRLPDSTPITELQGERGEIPGLPDWEWVLGEGHAPGHLLPWHSPSGTLIAGDQFFAGLKTPLRVGDPDEDSYGSYLATVRRVAGLRPTVMLPSHTGAIRDPVAWLERTERRMERQLARSLEAIRNQPRTAAQVVDAHYRSIPSDGARQLLLREQTAALRHLHLTGLAARSEEDGIERFRAG